MIWGSIVTTWGGPSRAGQGVTQRWSLRGAPRKKGELTEGWGPQGNASPSPPVNSSPHLCIPSSEQS